MGSFCEVNTIYGSNQHALGQSSTIFGVSGSGPTRSTRAERAEGEDSSSGSGGQGAERNIRGSFRWGPHKASTGRSEAEKEGKVGPRKDRLRNNRQVQELGLAPAEEGEPPERPGQEKEF